MSFALANKSDNARALLVVGLAVDGTLSRLSNLSRRHVGSDGDVGSLLRHRVARVAASASRVRGTRNLDEMLNGITASILSSTSTPCFLWQRHPLSAKVGDPQAPETLLKSRLAQRLAKVIEAKGLTQSEVAAVLQIDQPKVSKILRGRLREFSTDRLFRFLNALDQDIQIVIKAKPSSRRQARMTVVPG